jgi:hypothetical protein
VPANVSLIDHHHPPCLDVVPGLEADMVAPQRLQWSYPGIPSAGLAGLSEYMVIAQAH